MSRFAAPIGLGAVAALAMTLSSCGMMQPTMMKMMGMGDMAAALGNMDDVMEREPSDQVARIGGVYSDVLAHGKRLFVSAELGEATKGVSCESCHPNGGTTGGAAQVPMTEYQMPIPALVGAGATFPKYKVPNDAVITLKHMNNNCNKMFMGGKGLALDGPEAVALEAYVKSLSNGESFVAGKSRMDM